VESHICQNRADMGHPSFVTDRDLTTGASLSQGVWEKCGLWWASPGFPVEFGGVGAALSISGRWDVEVMSDEAQNEAPEHDIQNVGGAQAGDDAACLACQTC
jgi:hypothetical protein